MAISPERLNAYLADQSGLVATVKRDYPNLSTGELTDQVIHRLNREHATDVFGRKARNPDGSSPNLDTITIRLDDTDFSKKKMVDIWIGSKETPPRNLPTWQVIPSHEEPGNGYWRPAVLVDRDTEPVPQPPPEPDTDEDFEHLIVLLHQLESRILTLDETYRDKCKENAEATQLALNRVALLEQRIANLKVKGRTGTRGVFGLGNHSHDVDLSVTSD